MKVAITGGNGFLGSHVQGAVLEKGWQPLVLSRSLSPGSVSTDYSQEDLILKLKGCQAVAHLAGSRGVGQRMEFYHGDEIMTQNLYEAALALGIKNLIFASSISVYSREDKLPWKEDQAPTPVSFYGIGKLASEHIGDHYSRKGNFHIKNLRLAHLFGANEKNNYMINLFMRKAFHKEQLTLNTGSRAKREFLYVKDAARAVLLALEKEDLTGTFNIGSALALTNEEVALGINQAFGNAGNLSILDPLAEDTTAPSWMDHRKAEGSLGFKAERSFLEAMGEIYMEMKELDHVPILY